MTEHDPAKRERQKEILLAVCGLLDGIGSTDNEPVMPDDAVVVGAMLIAASLGGYEPASITDEQIDHAADVLRRIMVEHREFWRKHPEH